VEVCRHLEYPLRQPCAGSQLVYIRRLHSCKQSDGGAVTVLAVRAGGERRVGIPCNELIRNRHTRAIIYVTRNLKLGIVGCAFGESNARYRIRDSAREC
jgi:hypothetical protein